MANKVLIMGPTGSGKSASSKYLPEDRTYILKSTEKNLPFRGSKKKYNEKKQNTFTTKNIGEILNILAWVNTQKHIKYVMIDDCNLLMTYEFKTEHETQGEKLDAYAMYRNIAFHFMDIVEMVDCMRDDITVYFMSHFERNEFGEITFKTIGRFLKDQVVVECLFDICLLAFGAKENYKFVTNGIIPSKSPEGLFNLRIENNLLEITDKITEYYDEESEE